MTPEIFNELCSYAVDTKKDGVGSFSVLLPCNLLNYLVTGQRICLDQRAGACCFTAGRAFHSPTTKCGSWRCAGLCVFSNATIAAVPVEFTRCHWGNLPAVVPVPHRLCLNEVLSVFNLGGGGKSQWLKMLYFLFDFSFLLINNSSQCCGDTYSLWKINSYRLLVTEAAFWCPDKGTTHQLAGSGAASQDQGIPLDLEDVWLSCSLFTLISASVQHMLLKLKCNFISNSSVMGPSWIGLYIKSFSCCFSGYNSSWAF